MPASGGRDVPRMPAGTDWTQILCLGWNLRRQASPWRRPRHSPAPLRSYGAQRANVRTSADRPAAGGPPRPDRRPAGILRPDWRVFWRSRFPPLGGGLRRWPSRMRSRPPEAARRRRRTGRLRPRRCRRRLPCWPARPVGSASGSCEGGRVNGRRPLSRRRFRWRHGRRRAGKTGRPGRAGIRTGRASGRGAGSGAAAAASDRPPRQTGRPLRKRTDGRGRSGRRTAGWVRDRTKPPGSAGGSA